MTAQDTPSLHKSDIENSGVDIDKPSDELRKHLLNLPIHYLKSVGEADMHLDSETVDAVIQLLQAAIDAAVKEARIDEINQAVNTYKKQLPDEDGILVCIVNDLERRKTRLLNQPQEKK